VKTLTRTLIAIVAAGALSACGGGGSSQPTPVSVPTAASSAGSSSQNKTPLGYATLTLKGSPNFHTASASKRGAKSARRGPAYVNSNALYLDVFVVSNGIVSHVVDSTSGPNVTLANPDGSQTLSIPIFTQGTSSVVAYETDSAFATYGNVLSVGETEVTGYTPGSTIQLAMTMQMNANQMGVMSDPNNANFDAVTQGVGGQTPWTEACNTSNFYFFSADINGGFVSNVSGILPAGAGGTALPYVTGTNAFGVNPAPTLSQGAGIGGAYSVNFNAGTVLRVFLRATNPAYDLASSVFQNGAYPGLSAVTASGIDPNLNNALYSIYILGSPTPITGFDITYNGC